MPDHNHPAESIAIIDFGSQYAQLIARRVREHNVYSFLVGPGLPADKLREINPSGIIMSGGPGSVYDKNAPRCGKEILKLGIPVLGICYGMQLGCSMLGAEIRPVGSREYGGRDLDILSSDPLLKNIPVETSVWMSHGDQVEDPGENFDILARTSTCPNAVIRHKSLPFYGLQFHPEVTHTPHGNEIFENFLYDICGCSGKWTVGSFVDSTVSSIRQQVGLDEKVVCGLSGGVDSAVVAAIIDKAVGDRLNCIFVNNGLLRLNEARIVESTFRKHFKLNLETIEAEELFLEKLKGISEPQEKRKIIGHTFVDVFKEAASRIDGARYLAQGTLYPDVIESGQSLAGEAANIKLHHNVGGLPEQMGFELVEPLRDLFKDEVRKAGELLGLPEEIVWRHPFPGPGLAVRCLGEVNGERLNMLREADNIVVEEIRSAGLYRTTAQAFAVLLPVNTVGVMGDGRTYENTVAVRSVDSSDFMTADWSRIPPETLAKISSRIINSIKGINRVVYDISSKPPSTIEWE